MHHKAQHIYLVLTQGTYLRVVLEVCRLPLAAHRTPTAPAPAPLTPGTRSIPTTNPKLGARLRVAAAGRH